MLSRFKGKITASSPPQRLNTTRALALKLSAHASLLCLFVLFLGIGLVLVAKATRVLEELERVAKKQTKKMGSSNFLVAIVLLFAGTLVAVVLLKGESRAETKQIVPLPQIGGGALRRGPWPGCLGIEGTDCQSLIESYAPDVEVFIVDPNTEQATGFSAHRVKVFVDGDGIVTKIPLRG